MQTVLEFLYSGVSYYAVKMSEISANLRFILQFYFNKGINVQARKEICAVYGQDTLSKATAKRWFSRFCSGFRSDFDVQNAPRNGRSITEKMDDILKVEQNQHVS